MSNAPSQPSQPSVPPSGLGSGPSSVEEVLPRQLGKYTLLKALASGGMAKVYLAIQRAVAGFEKLVVIKRILPELARDPAFVEMLLTEARTAATLNHPNIVQTFDVGEADGTYYIAMEHINGEDIRSIVRAMKRASVAEFPVEHTLGIILGMCAGLAYAHEKKDLDGIPLHIVHRDISPQNVLITFTGDVKIVDFGIAKTSEVAIGERTQAGQLKGKVPYMSPEQASGREVDHRSDIFAVGIMLFELTTGRRLFKAKSEFETLKLICERDYPTPSQIRPNYPAPLETIVMKALAKDPEERYQSARDMQADIETFVREDRVAVSAVSLARWMKMLFEDKIAEQKEALQDVKHLADVIASQKTTITETDIFPTTTTGAATITGTDISAYANAGRGGNKMWMVGVAVVAAAAGGAAFFLAMSKPPAGMPTPGTTVTATAPPEVAVKKGSLEIVTDPPGAFVRYAGELHADKTPCTLAKLPLGTDIEVKISLEGYETVVKTIHLTDAESDDALDIKLPKGSVTVEFKVIPETAILHVDDKRWEGKGTSVEGLAVGEHKFIFTAPGHLPKIIKFSAKKGDTKKFNLVLEKGDPKSPPPSGTTPPPPEPAGPPGSVNVASSGGYCANVSVGGRSVGPTPVAGISVPAGPVSIVCTTADGRRIGSGAQVKSGQTSRVTIPIPPK
jgi:eukaryotic-like serine/threonine-protein kinase